jgi:hypothetical protein
MAVRYFSAAPHTVSFQAADTDATASSDWKYPRLIVIRLTDVFNYGYFNTTNEQNTTSTTMQNAGSVNVTAGNNALVFGAATRRGVTTGVDYEMQLSTNGGALNLSKNERRVLDANDYEATLVWQHNRKWWCSES